MAPASNHKTTQSTMDETFSLTNMSPQARLRVVIAVCLRGDAYVMLRSGEALSTLQGLRGLLGCRMHNWLHGPLQVGAGFNRDYWARFERFVQVSAGPCNGGARWPRVRAVMVCHQRPSITLCAPNMLLVQDLTRRCDDVWIVTGPLYLPQVRFAASAFCWGELRWALRGMACICRVCTPATCDSGVRCTTMCPPVHCPAALAAAAEDRRARLPHAARDDRSV